MKRPSIAAGSPRRVFDLTGNTNPTTQREFVIPLQNKPGTVAEIASSLGKANVNILGFLVEAQGDFGVARILTSDPAKTEGWLKQTNRLYHANDVITVNVPNNPGELGRIASKLAASGVNINAAYPTITPGSNNPSLTLAVNDIASARKVLGS
jgi:hypothetical protein